MSGIEEFLEHHGVKGQKWGIRNRSRSKSSGSSESSDAAVVKELRKKHVSTLNNEQLKLINNRINLEQQFKRMNPGKVTSGRKQVEAVLATVGVGFTVFNMANSPAGKAAISAGKKALTR